MVRAHEQQSRLMRWTSDRPVSMLIFYGIILNIVIAMREVWLALGENRDVNGEGSVNFADLPGVAYALLTAVGEKVQSIVLQVVDSSVAGFLHMKIDPPNPFWPVLFSAVVYCLAFVFAKRSFRSGSTL